MFKTLTTVRKVGFGFFLLTTILVMSVGLTIWQVNKIQLVTHQLVNQSSPMTEASLRVINGLNDSAEKARGYVLLGDERFKAGRAAAFTDWVDPGVATLKKLVEESGTSKQKEEIAFVEQKVKLLKNIQSQQEAIAQTDENFPAHALMQASGDPLADEIIASITAMIDEESALEASPERKQLLYQLANFRGVFTRRLAALRELLNSQKQVNRQRFQRMSEEQIKTAGELDEKAQMFLGTQAQDWTRIKARSSEFETLAATIIELRQSDQWNVAVAIMRDKAAPTAREVQELLEKFIAELEPQNKTNRETLVSATSLLTRLEWALLTIGVVVSIALGTIIIRTVEQSIAIVLSATQEVGSSASEISSGSQQQVASLNQTATSLNEITSTAEEFRATMQEFADRARAVQEAAIETVQRSTEGRTLAQQSASRIEQVRKNSQAAGESVLNLAEQMQRISEITATVNEIAEQTKLLALNASIEAARAGEEGRGFAVVATQVRELANESKQAASRIESLIGSTQKSMQDVVGKIEDGGRLADQSTEIVRSMTDSFDRIATAIKQTTDAMTQITTGARQQELGISELVSSITEIDSASKESLTASQQTLRAIVSIDAQIGRLTETMARF